MENIPALLNCRCGGMAEMQTSINFCWVECLECQRTGTSATDYPTAANNWNTQEAKMENLPARNMNPPESNAPDCPQCGVQMETKRGIAGQFYTCENYLCELYTGDKDDRISELLNHIGALQDVATGWQKEKCDAQAEVERLRDLLRDCLNAIGHANSIDFSNGVVAPDGSDEGTVRGNEFLLATLKKICAALDGPQ